MSDHNNSYYGSCYLCEPIGEENKRLEKQLKIALKALSHYELHDLYEPIRGKEMDEKTARFAHELGEIARQAIKEIKELKT